MPEENSTELELELDEEQSFSSHLRTFLDTILHLFYLAAPDLDEATHTQSLKLNQFLYAGVLLIKTIQMVSLLYPISPFLQDWEQFSLWTTIVGIFRVDYLLVRLSMGQVMLYAGIAIAVLPIIAYLTLYRTLRAQGEKKWRLRVFLVKTTLKLSSGVLYMPLLAIFVAAMRYPNQ